VALSSRGTLKAEPKSNFYVLLQFHAKTDLASHLAEHWQPIQVYLTRDTGRDELIQYLRSYDVLQHFSVARLKLKMPPRNAPVISLLFTKIFAIKLRKSSRCDGFELH